MGTEADATPAQRIEAAIQVSGEPDPASPLLARLSQGRLTVLHREQVVSPMVPLIAPPPTPPGILPRRTNIGAGWDNTEEHPADSSVANMPQGISCAAGVAGLVMAHDRPSGATLAIGILHCMLISAARASPSPVEATRAEAGEGQDPLGDWQPFSSEDVRLTDGSALASAEEHVRLATRLYCSPADSTLGWYTPHSGTGAKLTFFRLVVWAPHRQYVLFLPSDSTFARAHDLLGRLRSIPDRGKSTLIHRKHLLMHCSLSCRPPTRTSLLS